MQGGRAGRVTELEVLDAATIDGQGAALMSHGENLTPRDGRAAARLALVPVALEHLGVAARAEPDDEQLHPVRAGGEAARDLGRYAQRVPLA